MRPILFINLTAVHGGAEEVLADYMWVAQQLGHQPVLVVPQRGWLTERCDGLGIEVEVVPSLPETFATSRARDQARPIPTNVRRLAAIVRKRQAALVVCNSPRAVYHGGPAARLTRRPCLVHVHDIVGLPYASWARARLLGALTNATVAVSHAVQEAILGAAPWLEDQVRVIYNGYDRVRYGTVEAADLRSLFDVDPGTPVIGCVSAMTWWKGQDVALEAARLLAEQGRRFILLVVGGPQGDPEQVTYERRLRAFVAERGLGDRVRFTGWREDAWSVIKSLDVLVHVPTEGDPLPGVVIHALGLGTPVVGSAVGGIPELLDQGVCGALVPPRDAAATAVAIARVLDNEGLRRDLAERGKKRQASVFSRERLRVDLGRVYSPLLAVP